MSRPRSAAARQAWGLTALFAVAAAVLSWPVTRLPAPVSATGSLLAWVALVGGFCVAEACVAHLTVGREAHSFALSEIPFIVGLFYFSPGHLVLARIAGTALALVVVRRQPVLKCCFNLAQYWLGSLAAIATWHLVAGSAPSLDRAGLGVLAATLVMSVLSVVALSLALFAVGEPRRPEATARAGVTGLLTASANTALALVAITVARVDPWLLLAVAVMAGFLALAERSHVQLQKRHDSLQRLNAVTRDLSRDLSADAIVARMLAGAVGVLDGVDAEFTPGADQETGQPRRVGHRRRSRLRAAVVAHDGPLGTLTVESNPNLHGFGEDDEHVLDALAQHAGVALANGRLADQLREQVADNAYLATHDTLTGLANRLQFQREATAVMAGGGCAVLLLDLDRFKEVNDTLGHDAGDALLQDVGARLTAALPAAVCIARLGGDEFAVLLPTDVLDESVDAAQTARHALLQPLDVMSVPVSVDASIGIALAPLHGRTCDELLRHADVAMYAAKEGRGAVEVYRFEIDHNDPTRLSIASELREAISGSQLTLSYQPKVSLTGSPAVSVEALARWPHPSRGMVMPDMFIPIAEQTGVILELTDWVLATALEQCRAWLDDGLDMSVAVNLSPRVLRDATFCDRLVGMLEQHRIPASRLILEITESAVMADITHSIEVLWALRRAGVKLAIDDLGVGHSSLSYLKRLPVHEVKIDKSFVMTMTDDPADDAIVCAVIGLAHRLGLTVIAEGVETKLARDRLVEVGCDSAQGFWYSRPVPAAEIRPFFAALASGEPASLRVAG